MATKQEIIAYVRQSMLDGNPVSFNEAKEILSGSVKKDVDLDGRSVKVVMCEDSKRLPVVKSNSDVVVFAHDGEYLGWLPSEQVNQIPGSFSVLSPRYLFEMPVEWKFVPSPCTESPCTASGVWDYYAEAWECFKCERFNFDESTRRQAESDLAECHKVSEGTDGA